MSFAAMYGLWDEESFAINSLVLLSSNCFKLGFVNEPAIFMISPHIKGNIWKISGVDLIMIVSFILFAFFNVHICT